MDQQLLIEYVSKESGIKYDLFKNRDTGQITLIGTRNTIAQIYWQEALDKHG